MVSRKLFLISIVSCLFVFSGCAARGLARRDVVAQHNVAQLAGIHLSMIEDFTVPPEDEEKPSLGELQAICRHGRQIFWQAIFYADSARKTCQT